ncbi:ferredoxin-type protein NapF [Catenovulum sp. SM1970]|uniref:ferredoxin-type protein NapF n=1 Tax=Marinifaba aquimaris TaxID=2741323 RepID=UPI001571684D|nr:ferredoxin-type protein NapF [Marinifaba aquimaris]NTS78091.1 ferredoxin-type protein NapF [Marinifaba aquimaris]
MLDRTKRNLLNRHRREDVVVRPPWSDLEEKFLDKCQHCNACIEQCETQIIVIGEGGSPEIDFNLGECTECKECLDACEPRALDINNPKSQHIFTIKQDCLAHNAIYCQSCKDECEAGAIQFSFSRGAIPVPSLNNTQCTDCGACISVCPSQSIITTKKESELEHV